MPENTGPDGNGRLSFSPHIITKNGSKSVPFRSGVLQMPFITIRVKCPQFHMDNYETPFCMRVVVHLTTSTCDRPVDHDRSHTSNRESKIVYHGPATVQDRGTWQQCLAIMQYIAGGKSVHAYDCAAADRETLYSHRRTT